MDWKEVGGKIAKSAPLLGQVVGSFVPGAGAIGTGIGLIARAFGLSGDATPEETMKAISADPEAAMKLQAIENDHQAQLARIGLELDQAYLADRQSARMADVEKTKATGSRDYMMYALAIAISLGFFGLCGMLMFKQLPEGSQEAVFMLFGGMVSSYTAVVQYFFGSSKSSGEKTKLIAEAARK